MARIGVTQPPVDFLADLPTLATDGTCIVSDPRGTGRYGYVLLPTAASTWSFYRIDLYSRALQVLATPARAATTVTAGAKMIFDVTGGILATPTIWLFAPDTAGGTFFRWQSYDIANDVWTARSSVLAGMAAIASVDCSLAHPCSALGAPAVDQYVYANGDAGVWGGAGLSNLARYDITNDAWARVTGGGGVRGGAPAIGSSLDWLPNTPDFLYSMRGGGSGTLDCYSIVGNSWTNIAATAINPAYAGDTEGLFTTTYFRYPFRLACFNGGQIVMLDLTAFGAGPAGGNIPSELVASIDGTDGTAHQGNCLFAYNVGEHTYVGILPHAAKTVQRIRLVF